MAKETARGRITATMSTKEKILVIAKELCALRGFDGLSMRTIASRLDMTAMALYRHFANKDALLWEIINDGFAALEIRLRAALRERAPEKRLRRSFEEYLAFALEEPMVYKILFMNPSAYFRDYNPPEAVMEQARRPFELLVGIVGECMESGFLLKDDAFSVAFSLWSAHHGLLSIYFSGVAGLGEEQVRALYFASAEHFLSGLASQ